MRNVEKRREVTLPSTEEIEQELENVTGRAKKRSLYSSSIKTLLVVCAVTVILGTVISPVLKIYGTSMNPTLEQGELVISLKTNHIDIGDVIGVKYGNSILVKRCMANAGQWVDIDSEGNVYVDDQLVEEPYITDKSLGETDIELPYQVPENSIFVMGDHRNLSIDSRNSIIGSISNEEIVGKIVFCVWPLSEFGFVN